MPPKIKHKFFFKKNDAVFYAKIIRIDIERVLRHDQCFVVILTSLIYFINRVYKYL